jgi:membrane-associated phospholipid phosphatase
VKIICFLLAITGIPLMGCSQATNRETDTDTAIHPLQSGKPFPVRSLLLPATMIMYGVLALKTDALQDLDEHTQEDIWSDHPHRDRHIDNYLQFAPAATVYALNLAGVCGANDLADRSAIYVMSNIFLNIAVFSLKKTTHQERPDGSDYLSFPSGHTAEAFASAEFLRREYAQRSPWYGIGGYLMAAVTGYLRMYNNKHYLSDLIGGAGIGIASTDLSYWLYPKIKRLFSLTHKHSIMILPFYQQGGAGIALTYPLR